MTKTSYLLNNFRQRLNRPVLDLYLSNSTKAFLHTWGESFLRLICMAILLFFSRTISIKAQKSHCFQREVDLISNFCTANDGINPSLFR